MGQTIYQVDAFADQPFTGNPAGVCLLPKPAPAAWMQAVALEMNLSETAFLVPQADGFDLRWFTPAREVELCGHATLASAHVLWQTRELDFGQQARFHTLSGLLTAQQNGDWIEMDFPATPATPAPPPDGLIEALGVQPIYTGKNVFDYLVEVESDQAVLDLQPDFGLLRRLPARGIIVTAQAKVQSYDFVSRFFAPAVGVNEDPVTGSAHCCLAPYWAARLGKTEMVGRQLSARRGTVRVRLAGDRVILGGQAVTVFAADMKVPVPAATH